MESLPAILFGGRRCHCHSERRDLSLLVPSAENQILDRFSGARTPENRLWYLQCRDRVLPRKSSRVRGLHGVGMPR
jgi:hypothetical protein